MPDLSIQEPLEVPTRARQLPLPLLAPHHINGQARWYEANLACVGSSEMAAFFQPLIARIVDLFQKQYRDALDNGHAPGNFLLCGGLARNQWFARTCFNEIQKLEPGMICSAEVQ